VISRVALALALLFCAACAACVLGCGGAHLVGTNDVELDYRVEPAPKSIDRVVTEISARLGAAKISADVDERGADGVRVTIDRDGAKGAEELLAWRGGIDLYEVDPSAPPDARATLTAEDDARAITVRAPPLATLRDEIASVETPDGKSVRLTLTAAGSAKIDAAARTHEGAEVAFARGLHAIRVETLRVPADPSAIVLPFGDDLYAYARAHRARLLLKSPILPRLVPTRAAPLPVNALLAASCVVIPMLLSFAWIFFVRRFDRAHPEPMWLVLSTFALGGLSVIPAGCAEWALMRATPYLDPILMTLGGQMIALPIALVVFTLVVGLSEESSKLLGAWSLAYQRREFDEPVDGIVYGAVSALGFAAVENVKYFTVGRLSAVIVIVRTFMSIPAHMFFGAIWGYAAGRKLVRRTSIALFLALAAAAHGAFDTFLAIDGMALFAVLLNVGLATLFVVLLRKALRHGVVTAEAALASARGRALFRVGSPAGFLAAAVAMHVLAAMVFVLGIAMEMQHQRVGFGFVSAMSALLVALIVAAYALSRTMPLDVAVDAYGVTFAGSSRAWRTVRGASQSPRAITLRSTEGDLILGPGAPSVVDALARAIDAASARASSLGGATVADDGDEARGRDRLR
jgi:RsiW-degrading membrane proteinase PrsW (M82 family)